MKSRWLMVVLITSLVLNLAAVGAFAYSRYRKWQWRQGLLKRLAARAPERVMPLINEHQFKMDSLRMEYWKARRELAQLSFSDTVNARVVEEVLERIAANHREMNRLVYETGRKTAMLFPPEQRERFRRRCCEMLEGPFPPPGMHPRRPGRMRPKPGRF